MNEAIYFFGFSTTSILLGSIWLACVLYAAGRFAIAFIDDAQVDKIFGVKLNRDYYHGKDGGHVIGGLLLAFFIGLMASLIWMIAWPVVLAVGFMLAARKFRRFTKMFKRHRHDDKGDVVDRGWR